MDILARRMTILGRRFKSSTLRPRSRTYQKEARRIVRIRPALTNPYEQKSELGREAQIHRAGWREVAVGALAVALVEKILHVELRTVVAVGGLEPVGHHGVENREG